jgi:AcrR family transcriptional regulator
MPRTPATPRTASIAGGGSRRAAPAPRYHHGDLRAALLRAAEDELTARGTEGFSLRGVARRVGVSHAAPAHHFADTGALLAALAAEGFRRFLATQRACEARAAADPRAQLLATGAGYIAFAAAHPALFRLMFASDRPTGDDPDLTQAACAAFDHLAARVAALGAPGTAPTRADLVAAWAMAHGLADLINAGRLDGLLPAKGRDEAIAAILGRAIRSAAPQPSAAGKR